MSIKFYRYRGDSVVYMGYRKSLDKYYFDVLSWIDSGNYVIIDGVRLDNRQDLNKFIR